MINDPIKYVRDRSTEDADCWLWSQACTSNGTPTMHQPHDSRRTIAVRRFLAAALGQLGNRGCAVGQLVEQAQQLQPLEQLLVL